MEDYSKVYLLIGIPTVDYIHWAFAKCLNLLTRHLDELGVHYEVCWKAGSLVYISRDKIAMEAFRRRDTHVLWLDADMIFYPDIFEKLLKTMNEQHAPLVSGIYNSRHQGRIPVLYKALEPEVDRFEDYPEETIFDIAACGFGCCLTRVEMLDDIWGHEGTCFSPTSQFGEDLMFCKRATDLRGYKMVADQSVCCGHIGQRLFWPDNRSELIECIWDLI